MLASPNLVVGWRPVSYLCGGLAPRFLFFSSDLLLARNMQKPTTTHRPTTGLLPPRVPGTTHREGMVVHGNPGRKHLWLASTPARAANLRVCCQIRAGGRGARKFVDS
jgi:hypothetical protein